MNKGKNTDIYILCRSLQLKHGARLLAFLTSQQSADAYPSGDPCGDQLKDNKPWLGANVTQLFTAVI